MESSAAIAASATTASPPTCRVRRLRAMSSRAGKRLRIHPETCFRASTSCTGRWWTTASSLAVRGCAPAPTVAISARIPTWFRTLERQLEAPYRDSSKHLRAISPSTLERQLQLLSRERRLLVELPRNVFEQRIHRRVMPDHETGHEAEDRIRDPPVFRDGQRAGHLP